ncbi:hypothetical protein ZIOFF_051643 [Zingiber officinale]|uniref:RNA 3'-terminal phosphate cyclase domain-containing protein n=1 Tax=Zingiber officinale TaxID=94328 RepID=A0A8J5KUS6_ZINOF|nr:hypothetical protein ZIOFF_051643 [Zingiber officinale]
MMQLSPTIATKRVPPTGTQSVTAGGEAASGRQISNTNVSKGERTSRLGLSLPLHLAPPPTVVEHGEVLSLSLWEGGEDVVHERESASSRSGSSSRRCQSTQSSSRISAPTRLLQGYGPMRYRCSDSSRRYPTTAQSRSTRHVRPLEFFPVRLLTLNFRNETEPGVLVGGGSIWCMTVAIGYLLEPFILLALFGKKSLSITLKGITNDSNDHSVDTFRTTTLHMLKRFGIPSEGLELKIVNWGALPLGGEIFLGVPTAPNTLTASHWVDEGMVQSIRGVTFSTRVSPQIGSRMIYAARGVFNHFMPDVHIFTDYRSGPSGGRYTFFSSLDLE